MGEPPVEGSAAAMADLLSRLGITVLADGQLLLRTAFGCRRAEKIGKFCEGCRRHDALVVKNVCLGRVFGTPMRAHLTLVRPRCRDGRIRAEWPVGFNQAARLPEATIFSILCDATCMSCKDTAARHGVARSKVNQIFAAFCTDFWRFYRPRLPDDGYVALDVGHLGGKNHLLVAAVMPKGEAGSHLIVVLPYGSAADRAAALGVLRGLPGRDRLKAVACDLSPDLAALIEAAWPGIPIVADLRHVIADLLAVLATVRNAKTAALPRRMDARTPCGQLREGAKFLLESPSFKLDEGQLEQRDLVLAMLGDEAETMYWLSEYIPNWYKYEKRNDAEQALKAILSQIDSLSDAAEELSGFFGTVSYTWNDRIMNYFNYHITTAFVEEMVKLFKQRYVLWSVCGDFNAHYVRMLVANGPLAPAVIDAIRWHTAHNFRPEPRHE